MGTSLAGSVMLRVKDAYTQSLTTGMETIYGTSGCKSNWGNDKTGGSMIARLLFLFGILTRLPLFTS
jgi:hypothetical protein